MIHSPAKTVSVAKRVTDSQIALCLKSSSGNQTMEIHPYLVDPVRSFLCNSDLSLLESGILTRLVNFYFMQGRPFSYGQAVNQIGALEDQASLDALDRVLDLFFIQEDDLYRFDLFAYPITSAENADEK